ncbi:MAG: hypothetical protein QXX95_07320 [Nitrososphaerales archaeon]
MPPIRVSRPISLSISEANYLEELYLELKEEMLKEKKKEPPLGRFLGAIVEDWARLYRLNKVKLEDLQF